MVLAFVTTARKENGNFFKHNFFKNKFVKYY